MIPELGVQAAESEENAFDGALIALVTEPSEQQV